MIRRDAQSFGRTSRCLNLKAKVYKSALLPAPFERVQKQLEAVSPYVEEILIYEYPGLMNKPGSTAFAGHPSSEKLYEEYMAYRAALGEK